MSAIGDFIKGVVTDVLQDMARKASSSRRARRRKRTTKLTVAEQLRRLERLIKPAKRQTSRRKTVRSRSKTKRRAY
ncbi:hypothetical protein [Mesorhizobium sp. KR9-304]|uniref:hypothetical protein n=1 Tax=Mesorhizobium sp. KR9-304 TaxID=3156614 RepID=UPI0032B54823